MLCQLKSNKDYLMLIGIVLIIALSIGLVKFNLKTTKDKNSDKLPAYKKEEKPKVVNGGTGSDGVLRDLNGNPIHVEGDPDGKTVKLIAAFFKEIYDIIILQC